MSVEQQQEGLFASSTRLLDHLLACPSPHIATSACEKLLSSWLPLLLATAQRHGRSPADMVSPELVQKVAACLVTQVQRGVCGQVASSSRGAGSKGFVSVCGLCGEVAWVVVGEHGLHA